MHCLKISLFAILLIGLNSCSDKAVLDDFQNIPEYGWAYDNAVNFEFDISDSQFYYQWYANLRISTDYPYSNIHLQMTTTAPDSTVKQEVVSIKLAEKSGKWLGKGAGSNLSFQEAFPNRKRFEQSGKYRVSLRQYMRVDTLTEVKAAGLRIEKQEEIY